MDGSRPVASPAEPWTSLAGFTDSPTSLRWLDLSAEQRKQRVIERLVDLFGEEAARPIGFEEQNRPAEVWSRGCYGASIGPGS